MEFIIPYIPYIVVALVLIGGAIFYCTKEKNALKNILLYLCGEAEKKYGGKTGKLKLEYCWSVVCKRFRFLSFFLTFEQFSKMVDDCLIGLRHLIETNPKIAGYVGAESDKVEQTDVESEIEIVDGE